jgi:hypothetical protein
MLHRYKWYMIQVKHEICEILCAYQRCNWTQENISKYCVKLEIIISQNIVYLFIGVAEHKKNYALSSFFSLRNAFEIRECCWLLNLTIFIEHSISTARKVQIFNLLSLLVYRSSIFYKRTRFKFKLNSTNLWILYVHYYMFEEEE